jgi:serine/threonine-protein kinase RsbW
MSAPPSVLVSVPAGPDLLSVLRAVAASVAARLDLSFDAVEDVRVAVDEAVSILLQVSASRDRLELRIDTDSDEMRAVLSIEAPAGAWPLPGLEGSWAWRVITQVCDEAGFERRGTDPAIRFVKRAVPR